MTEINSAKVKLNKPRYNEVRRAILESYRHSHWCDCVACITYDARNVRTPHTKTNTYRDIYTTPCLFTYRTHISLHKIAAHFCPQYKFTWYDYMPANPDKIAISARALAADEKMYNYESVRLCRFFSRPGNGYSYDSVFHRRTESYITGRYITWQFPAQCVRTHLLWRHGDDKPLDIRCKRTAFRLRKI
jgi:hypothetical protein